MLVSMLMIIIMLIINNDFNIAIECIIIIANHIESDIILEDTSIATSTTTTIVY